MRALKDVLPANVDRVLYAFYDFETTQNTRFSDKAKAHYPISSMCNYFVRSARKWKKTEIACDANRDGTRFGKTR